MTHTFRAISATEAVLLLTVDNAAEWLLAQNLITPADIVDGALAIEDAARRNRNLRVTRKSGRGYLLKQTAEDTFGQADLVALETAFYRFCHEDPAGVPLREFLPALVEHTDKSGTLALELLDGAVPLGSFWQSEESPDRRVAAARQLGRALAHLHAILPLSVVPQALRRRLSDDTPWILGVHRPPPSILERLSAGNLQTLKILQASSRATAALNRLRDLWSATSLIHNDIKSDNVLISTNAHGCRVSLVDWELVQVGDPAWDVAGVFTDLWVAWVGAVPFAAGKPAADALAESRQQLSVLFPAIRAFWSEYRQHALSDRNAWTAFLDRAVPYAAARLIQSAYEISQDAPILLNASVGMLQLAVNVLEDVDTAQVHLLGIPPSLSLTGLQR